MKATVKIAVALFALFASLNAQAAAGILNKQALGHDQGNGGDACEARFLEVRDDLASWMKLGGPKELILPGATSSEEYIQRMEEKLGAKVSCVTESLYVDGAEKTCLNFLDDKRDPQIACNTQRFMNSNSDDQYMLVHHEYAGLAGLETNHGAESDYKISSQISAFLSDQLVKKLALKPGAGRHAEQIFLNGDGSTTLVKPYFIFKGAKIPFLESSESNPKGAFNTHLAELEGICKRNGLSRILEGSARTQIPERDADVAELARDGSLIRVVQPNLDLFSMRVVSEITCN